MTQETQVQLPPTPAIPADTPSTFFFEGAEKLLEVWFASSQDHGDSSALHDLRDIPRHEIEHLLDVANCKILSTARSDYIDSYVLSESSLFVAQRRMILKTCGSTSLLYAVRPLLEMAKAHAGLDVVSNIFFSRKNFMKPHLQPNVHSSFDAEVEYLDELFDCGAGYVLGRVNRDCWYLYTLSSPLHQGGGEAADCTIEILMTELSAEKMATFTMDKARDGEHATKLAGIDRLLPEDAIIDPFLFEPVGYSMNAVLPHSDVYYTIHITPEQEFSYVSFETNIYMTCYNSLVSEVLKCFGPKKALITIIMHANIQDEHRRCRAGVISLELPGYSRLDGQSLELAEHRVSYMHYGMVKDNNTAISDESE